jgi:carbamoyltransferase
MTLILGISGLYHDSAACLLQDGVIVGAIQEERLTRKRHDASFPLNAIRTLLDNHGVEPHKIEHIVFYDKPFLKFERLLETYLAFAPRGFASFRTSMPTWLSDKLFQKREIAVQLATIFGECKERLFFSEHHLSHAASAFFPSPFSEAAVLSMDGVGEWTTTSLWDGVGNSLVPLKEIRFPHSLGLLYSACTYHAGFRVNSGEYKLMGLAPYGQPRYVDALKSKVINLHEDGSFTLNMEYFNYCTGLTMTSQRFAEDFGGPARLPEEPIQQRDIDLAKSVQVVLEDAVLLLARHLQNITGRRNLCLAGGVALNCVANGVLQRSNIYEEIWIQPAAGDAGGAVGAALGFYHLALGGARTPQVVDGMRGSYLGTTYSDNQIREVLVACNSVFEELETNALVVRTAKALADGASVGWFQGKMEFGPRALGARSILADPTRAETQRTLNLQVKKRESFRPFAPSVLKESSGSWFDLKTPSPYMLLVAEVKQEHRTEIYQNSHDDLLTRVNQCRSRIPAVTHVDYSARIHTVDKAVNPLFHQLLSVFEEITSVPILVNTSFNVRGEPIVESPFDAYNCFMDTELDAMAIGNFFLEKRKQPKHTRSVRQFELD